MLETMSGRVIPRQNWYAFRKMATTAILPLQQSAWRSLRKDASPWPSPRSKRLPAGTPFGSSHTLLCRELATAEQGELVDAREHYQVALALDPTNRIAERNIERLRVLMSEAGDKSAAPEKAEKAPVAIFVEETGKTGFAMLTDLASPRALAHVNPGDSVELIAEGNRLFCWANGNKIGIVEPRVAARLLKLLAEGNKYSAGITSLGDRDVRIVIREIFQDPRNYGKVSFPTAARSSDLRPYTKGTLLREEEALEEDLDDDDDDDEIQDLDRVLPAEVTGEEAFEDDVDEVDEP